MIVIQCLSRCIMTIKMFHQKLIEKHALAIIEKKRIKKFSIFDNVKISKIKSKKSIRQPQKCMTKKIEIIIEKFVVILNDKNYQILKRRQIKFHHHKTETLFRQCHSHKIFKTKQSVRFTAKSSTKSICETEP